MFGAMPVPLLSLGLSLGAALVAAPSAIFTIEVLASYLPRSISRRSVSRHSVSRLSVSQSSVPQGTPDSELRMAVLVPAHDEAAGIEVVVRQLLAELGPADRLVVVADNCTDDTAALARAAGAEVLERQDAAHRGKGYALSYGAEHLAADPPDVVVVMDADCRVARGSLRALAAKALASGRPTQAVYLLEKPAGDNNLSGISAFAFLVRNLVRPRGLGRLGLPCELTGTGMAFPWPVYRDAPATHGFLAEDRLLGHELALRRTPPLLDEDTEVVGELAQNAPASFKQRRRWEHGGLAILLRTSPRLLARGLLRANAGLIAQGFDSAVPPLALLVLLQTGAAVGTGAIALAGGPALPFALAAGGFTLLGSGVFLAWLLDGRELLPLSEVLRIPRYILWKLPLYASFARHGAHGEWERTDRGS